MSSVKWTVSSC